MGSGGLEARVHQRLEAEASNVGSLLRTGESGRQALLKSDIPADLKAQLRNLPAQALATPQAAEASPAQVRQDILAQECAAVQQTRQSVLAGIRITLNQQANELGEKVTLGLKNGFTASMTRMFGTSL